MTKKDYLILGVVLLLAVNLGLGLGVFVNSKFYPQSSDYKLARADLLMDKLGSNPSQLLDVELGITIEEQAIIDQFTRANNNQIQTVAKDTTNSSKIAVTSSKVNAPPEIQEPKKLEQITVINNSEPQKRLEKEDAPQPKMVEAPLAKIIPSQSSDKILDADGRKITYNLIQSGLNLGFVWATDIRDLWQKQPFNNIVNDNIVQNLPAQPTPLENIIPAIASCPNNNQASTIQSQKNWLSFSKYGVEAPIINGSFEDFYNVNRDGQINLNSPIQENQADINAGNYESVPVQKLLKSGVVHLPISPAPGQVGNSYIIGHTSNFPQVRSLYNKIFKPFESKSQAGDEFTIWDHQCRKMTFRVYEAYSIDENDSATAYQNVGNRRVVTLQGSILDANWQPTKRWLTRGELIQ